MEKNIPIMFCFDNNYVIPAAAAFYSLLENANRNFNYKFYVLHSDITIENQKKLEQTIESFSDFSSLEFIDMTNKFSDFWNSINTKGHFSKEVMYKVLVASIFPQYEKLIVSDVDVIFMNDISSSYINFNVDKDVYLAGVKAVGKIMPYMDNYKDKFTEEEIEKLSGFCGGYIVFNLKKLREDNMEEKFIDCFKNDGYRINQMEQDVLNLCCYPKTEKLPLNYVTCSYVWDLYKNDEDFKNDICYSENELKDAMENTIQLHYATSTKPWKNVDSTKADEWFKYIVKTPFLEEYLKKLPEKIVLKKDVTQNSNKYHFNFKLKIINFTKKNFILPFKSKLKLVPVKFHNIKTFFRVKKNLIVKKAYESKYIGYDSLRTRILFYLKKHPTFIFKKSFYKKIFKKVVKKLTFIRKKNDVIVYIFDDIFPSELSPFRYQEFVSYLENFRNVKVLTTGKAISYFNNEKIENIIEKFYEKHNNYRDKIEIIPFSKPKLKNFLEEKNTYKKSIAVASFLNNIKSSSTNNIDFFNKYSIPFIFTLYPGGGFALNDKESDDNLKVIFSSKFFRKVIVTQKVTKEYLINKKLCDSDKIIFIPGIVTPSNILDINLKNKKHYGINKNTFDICFVAHKYTTNGIDKGYDKFIESAKIISEKLPNVNYHVVGSFDENTINIDDIKEKIKFYGIQPVNWFEKFYEDKDIIVSPNVPNILKNGSFDGFPTGSCTEAMLNEVALFATDPLNQNMYLTDNDSFVKIESDAQDIANKVLHYYNQNRKLVAISKKGYSIINKKYSIEAQVSKRIKIIKEEISKI